MAGQRPTEGPGRVLLGSLVNALLSQSGEFTLRGLARHAGVSPNAIYRLINAADNPAAEVGATEGVRPATVKRIEAAMSVPRGLFGLVDNLWLAEAARLDYGDNVLVKTIVRSVIDPEGKLDWS